MNMASAAHVAGALTTVTAGAGGGGITAAVGMTGGGGEAGTGGGPPAPGRAPGEMTRTSTGAVPAVSMSSLAAAVYERSMMRSPTNGPRSLMRTTTCLLYT